jgi:hypothetical protein
MVPDSVEYYGGVELANEVLICSGYHKDSAIFRRLRVYYLITIYSS